MKTQPGTLVGALALVTLGAAAATGIACGKPPSAPPHEPPAEVHGARPETDLTRITLTEAAVRRLGIETTPCRSMSHRPTRTYGAELQVPPGRFVTVTAPAAGTLLKPEGGDAPRAGAPLGEGQEVLRLVPLGLLGEQDLVRSEADARARYDAAESRRARATLMLSEGAGSRRQLEEAEAEFLVAQSTLHSVTRRKTLLNQTTVEGPAGAVTAWRLTSPLAGRLVGVHAVAGQSVAQNAPLFDVASDRTLWVRVPVYAGEADAIDPDAPATVRGLGQAQGLSRDATSNGDRSTTATRVTTPPGADPLAATVDVFYQVTNTDGALRAGQKVAVDLRLRSSDGEAALVVPHAAVLYDIHGGTWVYVNPAPGEFLRERVEVRGVQDDLALLRRGPQIGMSVVTVGAAELFGTEFGVGH